MSIITSGIESIGTTNINVRDLLKILNDKKCENYIRRNVSISGASTILDKKVYSKGSVVETTYLKHGDDVFEMTNKQIYPGINKNYKFITSYIDEKFRRTSLIDLRTNVANYFEKKNGVLVQKEEVL